MSLLNSILDLGSSDTGGNVLTDVLNPVGSIVAGSDTSFTGSPLNALSGDGSLISDGRILSGPSPAADTGALPVGLLSFTDDSHPFPFINIEAGPTSALGTIVDGDLLSGSYGTKSPVDLDIGPDWNHQPLVDVSLLQDGGTHVDLHTEHLTDTILGGGLSGTDGLGHLLDLGSLSDLTSVVGSTDHLLGGIS